VQGQLLIGEFELVHFYSYHPRCPAAEFVARRDDKFIRVLSALLAAFVEQMDERLERCRRLGAYVVTHRLQTPMQAAFPEAGPDPLQVVLPD
jgi:hypothetical protein